ncbi:HlyD family type I secretion periplasmic adaptor subunit [Martelella mediterranea]|uniref:Membrane fusion protein (MFP) family protein n=1 Tax=Martelella mediterranea DSM 17316 TaxID=1122214 RepID=A0A1U9Z7X6_9HYPH|nr:HlyD family type I secretion periplasmic adaptor subunit [Martelella mediterranea]AQZ53823.1 Type I secretion system membrane fusion protein PrsE [Martelella mediterranea DSM 17316]AQZ54431.1 Type I secretion system membrane fusion protein PrsE [Martelella mediterranea DSM 17316]
MSGEWSAHHYLRNGFVALAIGVGAFALWGFATEINGAVIASGVVEVQARRQVIQHRDGGTVVEINVRDGESVVAGQPLIRLEETELLAERQMLSRQAFEAEARLARLASEVRGDESLDFGEELAEAAADDDALTLVLKDERSLFDARRETLALTLSQLEKQREQTDAMIASRLRQLAALNKQLGVVEEELERYQGLLDRGLSQASPLTATKQQAAELEGDIAGLEASIAEARGALAGYEVEMLKIAADRREAAQTEYRELQPQAAEIAERLNVAEQKYRRLSLSAPMDGVVYGLNVFTIGGVIQPGAEVAAILPANVPVILTVKVEPGQVDRVHDGQAAVVKFPNFNDRETPEFDGHVRTVSADALTDKETGQRYFRVEVALDPASLAAAEDRGILPGMPVEAFIQTGARSPTSYLLKPFTDYLDQAFREE